MGLTLYAVGDIMLGEQQLCNNFGVGYEIRRRGPEYIFEKVAPIFQDADIVFGNLECSIAGPNDRGEVGDQFFSAEPVAVEGLVGARFNALSVANNHIMENGRRRYHDTIRALRERSIVPIGLRDELPVLDIEGRRVALLGYSFVKDPAPDVGYNLVESEAEILDDIQEVRDRSDFVVVSLHWGSEYVPVPSPEQVRIGRSLVDAGADIVLGGHPHVTQGYEMYKNKPIVYSLGNFVFDDTYVTPTRRSFVVRIDLEGPPGPISLDVIPIFVEKGSFRPAPADPAHSEEILRGVGLVRSTLEGASIAEYSERIGEYGKLARTHRKKMRREMMFHFAKNWYRYSARTLINIVTEYAGIRQSGDQ
ncbi:Capsule biosynthesis protein CapA [anaerobic digester metagenome]